MVAHDDDLLVEATDVRIAPGAIGVGSPLEHRSGNMQRSGDGAIALTVDLGADVDEEGTAACSTARSKRLVARDSSHRPGEQFIECVSVGTNGHRMIM